MTLKNIKLDEIRKIFRNFTKVLAEHCFLFFLVLFFLSLIFGGVLFYQHNILIQKKEPLIINGQIHFKEKIYLKILTEWDAQEKKFEQVNSKTYINPLSKTREELLETEKKSGLEENAEKYEEIYKESLNLSEFYSAEGRDLPSVKERAKIWQEKGLGQIQEYHGLYSQNLRLLKELTK